MSETEHLKGKLKLVDIVGNTIELTCMMALQSQGIDPDPKWNTDRPFETQLMDQCYEDYIVFRDQLFKVIYVKHVDDEYDIFKAKVNLDNTVNFEVKYYNGGCSFEEAVNNALENIWGEE